MTRYQFFFNRTTLLATTLFTMFFCVSPAFAKTEKLTTYVSSPDWEYKKIQVDNLTVSSPVDPLHSPQHYQSCEGTDSIPGIPNPKTGQLCYDVTGKDIKYFDGAGWIGLAKVGKDKKGVTVAHAVLTKDVVIDVGVKLTWGQRWSLPLFGFSGWRWVDGFTPPKVGGKDVASFTTYLRKVTGAVSATPSAAIRVDFSAYGSGEYEVSFQGDVEVDGGWRKDSSAFGPLLWLSTMTPKRFYTTKSGPKSVWTTPPTFPYLGVNDKLVPSENLIDDDVYYYPTPCGPVAAGSDCTTDDNKRDSGSEGLETEPNPPTIYPNNGFTRHRFQEDPDDGGGLIPWTVFIDPAPANHPDWIWQDFEIVLTKYYSSIPDVSSSAAKPHVFVRVRGLVDDKGNDNKLKGIIPLEIEIKRID